MEHQDIVLLQYACSTQMEHMAACQGNMCNDEWCLSTRHVTVSTTALHSTDTWLCPDNTLQPYYWVTWHF